MSLVALLGPLGGPVLAWTTSASCASAPLAAMDPGEPPTPAVEEPLEAIESEAAAPLDPARSGIALRAQMVLTCNDEDDVFAPGMVWMQDGRIAYVGAPREVPSGWELQDFPTGWIAPGQIDLHSHVHSGGWGDTNDMVMAVNPELRASAAYRPSNALVRRACASGVTTLFGIPGSGTNVSGFGFLYKTKTGSDYAGSVLADPGGLKVAQDSNPQRVARDFMLGSSRAGMSYTLERLQDSALAESNGDHVGLSNLRKVMTRELPVLIHTAGGSGVSNTARMWKQRHETRAVISHGSFNGWKVADAIAEIGIPVNHGPRTIDWVTSRNGMINGTAAIYAERVPNFSLNTDAAVMPQEELFLQAAMSTRYGGTAQQMLRAITIHPARAFGIDHRVGSLEVGKDADVVVHRGDPLDPRSNVERVWIDGELQYERRPGQQWF